MLQTLPAAEGSAPLSSGNNVPFSSSRGGTTSPQQLASPAPSQHIRVPAPAGPSQLPPRRAMQPQATLPLLQSTLPPPQQGERSGSRSAASGGQGDGRVSPRGGSTQAHGLLRRLRRWWWEQRAPLVELVQQDAEHRLHAALGPWSLRFIRNAHPVRQQCVLLCTPPAQATAS